MKYVFFAYICQPEFFLSATDPNIPQGETIIFHAPRNRQFGKGLAGVPDHLCATCRSLFNHRRGRWMRNKVGVVSFNEPVDTTVGVGAGPSPARAPGLQFGTFDTAIHQGVISKYVQLMTCEGFSE